MSIAPQNHVITIIITYPQNLENISIICLQLQHRPYMSTQKLTTLLNITAQPPQPGVFPHCFPVIRRPHTGILVWRIGLN